MKSAKPVIVLGIVSLSLLAVVIWQAVQLHARRYPRESFQQSTASADSISSSSSFHDSAREVALDGNPNTASPLNPRSRISPLPVVSVSTTNKPKFDWHQVESDDYRSYVKNLRDIGCPEQTVRDIVAADVLQAFAARRAEVMSERFRDFKYWKSDTKESSARQNLEKNQREVDDAMSAALRELLGGDAPPPPTVAGWQQAALAQQLSFLPDDKRDKTQSLLLQYADVDAQIKELAWNHRTPENPEERLRVLEAYDRKLAALRDLLTPEEYDAVDMTASWTANNLRQAMAKFQPTEEEFQIIFREWRKQDESLATIFAKGEADPGNDRVFAAIEKQLSPERYAKYRETWWK